MNTYQSDEELWKIAKRRAVFKRNFAVHFFINAALVVTWYLTSGIGSYFWPVWPMLGSGFALAIQYTAAYHNNNMFSIEDEYQKLKRQQNNQL
ncbi:MAG: 2TM domain-containing protein [Parafilimonas sp.]|nr:2TM domain-containing protein [Parafilimonas sp.]